MNQTPAMASLQEAAAALEAAIARLQAHGPDDAHRLYYSGDSRHRENCRTCHPV